MTRKMIAVIGPWVIQKLQEKGDKSSLFGE